MVDLMVDSMDKLRSYNPPYSLPYEHTLIHTPLHKGGTLRIGFYERCRLCAHLVIIYAFGCRDFCYDIHYLCNFGEFVDPFWLPQL